jgi:hypothetical protein
MYVCHFLDGGKGGRGGFSNTLWLSSSSTLHFLLHHPVNIDDQHHLAHAMASNFTITSKFSQREELFCYGSNSTPLPYACISLLFAFM